jgi:hypothetical protein
MLFRRLPEKDEILVTDRGLHSAIGRDMGV